MILDPKTSQRIFELARAQQDELEMPEDEPVVASSSKLQSHAMRDDDIGYDDEDDENLSEMGEDIEETLVSILRSHIGLEFMMGSGNRCG